MTANTVNCFDRGLKGPPTLLISVASTWREGLVSLLLKLELISYEAITLFLVVFEDKGDGSDLLSCVFELSFLSKNYALTKTVKYRMTFCQS